MFNFNAMSVPQLIALRQQLGQQLPQQAGGSALGAMAGGAGRYPVPAHLRGAGALPPSGVMPTDPRLLTGAPPGPIQRQVEVDRRAPQQQQLGALSGRPLDMQQAMMAARNNQLAALMGMRGAGGNPAAMPRTMPQQSMGEARTGGGIGAALAGPFGVR